jgi:hypothetical protein
MEAPTRKPLAIALLLLPVLQVSAEAATYCFEDLGNTGRPVRDAASIHVNAHESMNITRIRQIEDSRGCTP